MFRVVGAPLPARSGEGYAPRRRSGTERATTRVTTFGIDLENDGMALDWNARTDRERVAEYGRGKRTTSDAAVDVPDGLTGQIVRAKRRIPRGETRTDDEVAEELDATAVGQACGRNPVQIVTPSHRVVGADGLGGFSAGADRALELKRLLDHEAARRVHESPPDQARLR